MESLKIKSDGDVLTAFPIGDIDHYLAGVIRAEIDRQMFLYLPRTLVLDLSYVEFCDSSGLGLIMGRYEKARLANIEFKLANPSERVKRLIRLVGFDKILPETEKIRK